MSGSPRPTLRSSRFVLSHIAVAGVSSGHVAADPTHSAIAPPAARDASLLSVGGCRKRTNEASAFSPALRAFVISIQRPFEIFSYPIQQGSRRRAVVLSTRPAPECVVERP